MSWNILAIILFLLPGCIQGNVTLVEPYRTYPPSAHVEVLKEKPARPFRTIAVVRATGQPSAADTELLTALVAKARSIGADAILCLPREENPSAGMDNPCAGGLVGVGADKVSVLKGLAIKYE